MISDQMVKALFEIKEMQDKLGVAKAPEIQTYQDSATLYRSLERMEKLELINSHAAPKRHRLSKTYTLTEYGKATCKKAEKTSKDYKQNTSL